MNIKQITLFILFFTLLFAGCKKEDNSSSSNSSNASFASIISTGTWHISYYHESNDDHTSDFNGYTFIFNSNGTMTATNGSGNVTGTWNHDDSQNEFHMSCGNNSPLSDLDSGWLIISKTNTEIVLKDDNLAHIEELHFSKI